MHKLSRAGFLVRLCVVSVYTFINFKTALELFAFTTLTRIVRLSLCCFFIGRRKSGAKSHLRVNSVTERDDPITRDDPSQQLPICLF